MTKKFLIFCETCTDNGTPVRYLSDIISSSFDLQERMVSLKSNGIKVFSVLPIFVDENNGSIDLKL